MTQGDLEKIPKGMERLLRGLEVRIMDDMVRRIRLNAFSTASADWQFTRLQQLGQSEEDIKAWVKELLRASNEEIDRIYSEEAYEEYMGHGRGYQVYGRQQIPFEENAELQQLIEGVKQQTAEQMQQITGSMGFVTKGYSGNLNAIQLSQYYQDTLDRAVMDIHSGAFDYNTVLNRTINEMTRSGLRWIDYESGWHNRVPVAARRAVMTGFRQVQGKINEQTARDLGTDSYEVTVHIGARPSHQVWEGKVYTMEQLRSVCGLGTGAGLHGWNCYHDYNAFIPGVSVRTYTDEQLDQIHEEENTPRTYQGKEYTTYEALQQQRKLETRARKYREDIHLLEEGAKGLPEADQQAVDSEIVLKQCRFRKTMQEYRAFSRKMELPMQKERIYQDGLKVDMQTRKKAVRGNTFDGKLRQREYGTAPEYSRDKAIDVCDNMDGIRKLFPEMKYLKGIDKLPLNTQKEVAQGFGYMRKRFGERALPITCNAADLGDYAYGKTILRQRKVMINKTIEHEDAFTTACHEAIHVYDYNSGLISEKILPAAFNDLGIKPESREADVLILDLLGWRLYNKYRHDYQELLAYAFEESLFGSENLLVEAVIRRIEGSIS